MCNLDIFDICKFKLPLNFLNKANKNVTLQLKHFMQMPLLPTRSEEREVLGLGSIPVAILTSCYDMKTSAS